MASSSKAINTASMCVCKRCKNKVVTGLKCVDCENYFHNSCARLTSNIKFLDDNTIKCCESEDTSDVAFYNALSDLADSDGKIDIQILKYIIKQKDCIIEGLRGEVKLLNQHVDLLMKSNKHGSTLASSSNGNSVENTNRVDRPADNLHERGVARFDDKVKQSATNVELLKSDISEPKQQNNWAEVVSKKKRNTGNKPALKPVLCGTSVVNNIKVVTKTKALFVSRLAPDVTAEEMTQHLGSFNMKPLKITQLKTKYNTYASFHIEVDEKQFDEMFDSKYWPAGCFVSQFYGKLRADQQLETHGNVSSKD